jgi:hypothetical protein
VVNQGLDLGSPLTVPPGRFPTGSAGDGFRANIGRRWRKTRRWVWGRMANRCSVCNQKAQPEDAYCANCGKPLDPSVPSAAPQVSPVPVGLRVSPEDESNGQRRAVVVWLFVLVVLGGLGLLAWQRYAAGTGDRHTLRGNLAFSDQGSHVVDDVNGVKYCRGTGGYSDISGGVKIGGEVLGGTQVRVRDESGKVLATSSLMNDPERSYPTGCNFDFELTNVPGAEFYQIEISHRGGLTFSMQDLERQSWYVIVSLGNPE